MDTDTKLDVPPGGRRDFRHGVLEAEAASARSA